MEIKNFVELFNEYQLDCTKLSLEQLTDKIQELQVEALKIKIEMLALKHRIEYLKGL